MAILSVSTDVLPFLRLSADDSYSTVTTITSSVEAMTANYCDRTLEAADYKELYNGTGTTTLKLLQFPVQRLNKIATFRRSVMNIWNSNTYTSASVEVISTGLILKYNGTAETANLTFATNTTIGSLVTAVNAIGNGWNAETISDYTTFKSNNLIPIPGRDAINSYRVGLDASDEGIDYIELNSTKGIVYRGVPFSIGFNNIFVDYRAGYESGAIPQDLKFAILTWIKDVYGRHMENSVSVSYYRIAGIEKEYLKMPLTVKAILDKNYRDVKV